MKMEEFKKGDLVRVVDINMCGEQLTLGNLHVVKNMVFFKEGVYVNLYSWNRHSRGSEYYPHRFKKINTGDLTPKELSSYIKYIFKIGVKS